MTDAAYSKYILLGPKSRTVLIIDSEPLANVE